MVDMCRVQGGRLVEHWDAAPTGAGPNASGHNALDGESVVQDVQLTAQNENLVLRFVDQVLIGADEFASRLYVSSFTDWQFGAPTLRWIGSGYRNPASRYRTSDPATATLRLAPVARNCLGEVGSSREAYHHSSGVSEASGDRGPSQPPGGVDERV